MANLSGTGTGPRLNGNDFLQPGVTVFDDLAADVLTVHTKHGPDWVFYNPPQDKLNNG